MTTPMTLEELRKEIDLTAHESCHRMLRERWVRNIDAAIREREEQAKVIARLKNPWRSIESAPKDGTWVLGLWIYHGEPVYRLCAFRNGSWLQKPGDWIAIATHWMPLLPPPNEVGEKNG